MRSPDLYLFVHIKFMFHKDCNTALVEWSVNQQWKDLPQVPRAGEATWTSSKHKLETHNNCSEMRGSLYMCVCTDICATETLWSTTQVHDPILPFTHTLLSYWRSPIPLLPLSSLLFSNMKWQVDHPVPRSDEPSAGLLSLWLVLHARVSFLHQDHGHVLCHEVPCGHSSNITQCLHEDEEEGSLPASWKGNH